MNSCKTKQIQCLTKWSKPTRMEQRLTLKLWICSGSSPVLATRWIGAQYYPSTGSATGAAAQWHCLRIVCRRCIGELIVRWAGIENRGNLSLKPGRQSQTYHANKSLYFSLEKDKMTFFLLHSSLVVPLYIYEFDFDWMPFLYLLRAHCWKNQIFHLFIAAIIIRWKKWEISIREKCLFLHEVPCNTNAQALFENYSFSTLQFQT